MSGRSRVGMMMSVLGVLQGLPGMFVSGKVILLPPLLGHIMGVRRQIVQFIHPPAIVVMGFRVGTSRHV